MGLGEFLKIVRERHQPLKHQLSVRSRQRSSFFVTWATMCHSQHLLETVANGGRRDGKVLDASQPLVPPEPPEDGERLLDESHRNSGWKGHGRVYRGIAHGRVHPSMERLKRND